MREFLRQLFSEESGKASFSRSASYLALTASIVWVTNVVMHTHAIPDLAGVALFIGTLYGLGKAGAVITGVMNGGAKNGKS